MFSNFNKALPDVFLTLTTSLNVETPATLTLSKSVCPSTSKSPFKSEFPSIVNPSPTTFPITLIPVFVVNNYWAPLKWRTTALPSRPDNIFA